LRACLYRKRLTITDAPRYFEWTFLRIFDALRRRLGHASESLTASFSNEHPPQFKIENSKFKITPAFLRASRHVSSPFGLWKVFALFIARRTSTEDPYTVVARLPNRSRSNLVSPRFFTPAASDHLLCQASRACACDVHRVRLGAAGSPFAHLAQRRRDGRPAGGRTGAGEGARRNGEVPPKRRGSGVRAGGDRARSARQRLFFARRASSEKGWVDSEAEAAGDPSKPSLCGWLCQV
jgi:hypothetical protein